MRAKQNSFWLVHAVAFAVATAPGVRLNLIRASALLLCDYS